MAADLRDRDLFLVELLDIVLAIHGLHRDQPGIEELRLSLRHMIRDPFASPDAR